MTKAIRISVLVAMLLSITVGVIGAQEEGERRGFLEGRVYKDVNGDGKCVNTGVAGEDPIPNINVQFVSSDEKTVITHYSGPEGIFGLVSAGYSWWRVTVMPGPGWTVTSDSVLYVPVFAESPAHTDINFCLSQGSVTGVAGVVGQGRVVALLPQSGGSANTGLTIVGVLGFVLLMTGLGLEIRRRSA
jgi:hypothetical protein